MNLNSVLFADISHFPFEGLATFVTAVIVLLCSIHTTIDRYNQNQCYR